MADYLVNGDSFSFVEGVKKSDFDEHSHILPAFGVCMSERDVTEKTVTVSEGTADFTLYVGVSIRVVFRNDNSIATPKLNVNNTGAMRIRVSAGTTTAFSEWNSGDCYDFIFDGIAWVVVGVGLLPTSRGGTGGRSASAGLYSLINGTTAVTATDVDDSDYIGIGDVSVSTGKKMLMSEVINYFSRKFGGQLLQEYTTAGTYTYTIPTGISELGIFMIGGGGAGGKLCDSAYYSSGDYYDEVTGGCAGVVNCAILNTSDISSLNIIVGQGGQSSSGGTTSVTTNTSQAFTALGGSQGIAISNTRNNYNLNMSNMVGGQLPFINTVNFQKGNRVAAGATNQYVSMSSLNSTFLGYLGGANNTPSQSINPFEKDVSSARKFLLSAGGCIHANNYNGNLGYANIITADAPNLMLPDIKGGDGKAITNATTRAPSAHGNDATGYGNGGGGMFVWTTYSSNMPDATNVTGGYGSDGAVFIYAR